jgi:hypothetical protein
MARWEDEWRKAYPSLVGMPGAPIASSEYTTEWYRPGSEKFKREAGEAVMREDPSGIAVLPSPLDSDYTRLRKEFMGGEPSVIEKSMPMMREDVSPYIDADRMLGPVSLETPLKAIPEVDTFKELSSAPKTSPVLYSPFAGDVPPPEPFKTESFMAMFNRKYPDRMAFIAEKGTFYPFGHEPAEPWHTGFRDPEIYDGYGRPSVIGPDGYAMGKFAAPKMWDDWKNRHSASMKRQTDDRNDVIDAYWGKVDSHTKFIEDYIKSSGITAEEYSKRGTGAKPLSLEYVKEHPDYEELVREAVPTLDERLDVPDVRTYTPAAGEVVSPSFLDSIISPAAAAGHRASAADEWAGREEIIKEEAEVAAREARYADTLSKHVMSGGEFYEGSPGKSGDTDALVRAAKIAMGEHVPDLSPPSMEAIGITPKPIIRSKEEAFADRFREAPAATLEFEHPFGPDATYTTISPEVRFGEDMYGKAPPTKYWGTTSDESRFGADEVMTTPVTRFPALELEEGYYPGFSGSAPMPIVSPTGSHEMGYTYLPPVTPPTGSYELESYFPSLPLAKKGEEIYGIGRTYDPTDPIPGYKYLPSGELVKATRTGIGDWEFVGDPSYSSPGVFESLLGSAKDLIGPLGYSDITGTFYPTAAEIIAAGGGELLTEPSPLMIP